MLSCVISVKRLCRCESVSTPEVVVERHPVISTALYIDGSEVGNTHEAVRMTGAPQEAGSGASGFGTGKHAP